MKKTKIDWCDSTINCVYGCPNGCKYCYGNVMNKRFHFCKNWNIPEWKPEHLKEFYSKKPKSIFIDSMSDIGTWKEEWFNAVAKAISDNPQHRYIALTKRFDRLMDMFLRFPPPIEIFIGISVTTQANANAATLVHRFHNTTAVSVSGSILGNISCLPSTAKTRFPRQRRYKSFNKEADYDRCRTL